MSGADSTDDALEGLRRLARDPTAVAGSSALSQGDRRKLLEIRRGLAGKDATESSEAKGGAQPDRPKRKKRRRAQLGTNPKRLERCSSPSHFHVAADDEGTYGEEWMLELPDRERVDRLMRAVGSGFYHHRYVDDGTYGKTALHPNTYDTFEYTTLDLVRSPVRKQRAWDKWTPYEIAVFEAGVCKHGKNFHLIQKLIKTKTTQELVHFYYTCWKGSAHYRTWKASGEPAAAAAKAEAEAGGGDDPAASAFLKPKASASSAPAPSA